METASSLTFSPSSSRGGRACRGEAVFFFSPVGTLRDYGEDAGTLQYALTWRTWRAIRRGSASFQLSSELPSNKPTQVNVSYTSALRFGAGYSTSSYNPRPSEVEVCTYVALTWRSNGRQLGRRQQWRVQAPVPPDRAASCLIRACPPRRGAVSRAGGSVGSAGSPLPHHHSNPCSAP